MIKLFLFGAFDHVTLLYYNGHEIVEVQISL